MDLQETVVRRRLSGGRKPGWQAAETMPKRLDPFRFLLIAVAGWMNEQQQHAIEYLREENRILRAKLGGRRLHFTDDQRRSLAIKARLLGRKRLAEMATHRDATDVARLAPETDRE